MISPRLVGIAAALWAGSLQAQAVPQAGLREGEATFRISATIVNDFTGRAPVVRAGFQGSDLSEVRGFLEIRVADMRTGNNTRDRHMREAMHADSLPTIRFDLSHVEPGARSGDTVSVVFAGELTIHGVTRAVRVNGRVVLRPQGADVTTEPLPVDMRDYGITPPVRALGTLRVRPVTHVAARLSFGQ
jgi:polyisoprenoid-binding protein YceI